MAGRYRSDLKWSDVTPKSAWLSRRQIMAGAAAAGLGSIAGPAFASLGAKKSKWGKGLELNTIEQITNYNNYYEFGIDKDAPAKNAQKMTVEPWSVQIGGMVDRPGSYGLEDILKRVTLEERIYRLRCVERWSMVVPWVGFELADLLKMAGVQSGAKYVAFETAYLPDVMPGLAYRVLDWPYREGLRLDEAMHPLAILATGLYDEPMPKQNGAPLRLVVPWKYGYKSIKSIVKITLVDKEPVASWNQSLPNEYGFYSNVNPERDHPRWSQKFERRIGGGLFSDPIPTEKFNGYEAEVAGLYAGMDLIKYH